MEAALRLKDCVVPIASIFDDLEPDGALPAVVTQVLPLLEQYGPGPWSTLSPSATRQLFERLQRRAAALVAAGGLPEAARDLRQVSDWDLLHVVIEVVARGIRPRDRARRMALADFLSDELPGGLRRQLRRVTGSRSRTGICRSFATSVQGLFLVAKRALGRSSSFVVTIRGRAPLIGGSGHAWNWFLDARRAVIVSIDLHTAARATEAGFAEDHWNAYLNPNGCPDATAFAVTLLVGNGLSDAMRGRSEVRALFTELMNAALDRSMWLYHLALHGRLGEEPFRYIERHLLAQRFEEPDWRRRIRAARIWLPPHSEFGQSQLDLLGGV